MYAGHVGIALGAKGIRRTVPLWVLVIASQLPDWTDAVTCLAGITNATPGMWSHSFPAIGILSVGAVVAYMAATRDVSGSAFVAAMVVSHALADYITGIKPTWSGGPMIGLQLYRHPAIDFAVEAVVIVVGWLLYQASFPREKRSSPGIFAMVGVLIALQLAVDIVFSMSKSLRKC